MKYIYLLPVLMLLAAGCSTDEIGKYHGAQYVYFDGGNFVSKNENTIEYSFAFHPNKDEDVIPLRISLLGDPGSTARTVSVSVVTEETTAPAGTYSLPQTVEFRAGYASDTLRLTVIKNAAMQSVKYRLRLLIGDSSDLLAGPVVYRHADIIFSDMITRPDWWDDQTVTANFLGTYSDTKYRLFIEATGVAELDDDVTESELRAYTIIFRDFLAAGREGVPPADDPFIDENGNRVDIAPGFL